MPVFPGQLRYIRKNLFHAVFVLDPGSACGLEACVCFFGSEFLVAFHYCKNYSCNFFLLGHVVC